MAQKENKLQLIRMADVPLTKVEWLWYPFIPFGKITIIQGNPGEGKTTLALRLAALCSTGQALPGMDKQPPFNILYQIAEDGLGDTIKPRLMEAQADLSRVFCIDETDKSLSLLDVRIEQAIRDAHARLMILDPLQAYIGQRVDMNRANEIRDVLKRLSLIADQSGRAVVLIGHLKLTAHDLQKLYKDLQENGRVHPSKNGAKGLSSTTVRSLHLMLHSALDRAVKERLIVRNPTEDCIAPKARKVEMKFLQPEEISAYLKAADEHGLLPMFFLELVSGLRKGELTALLWSDLDIENKTISVDKQYVRNPNGELQLSRPKTENSIRLVSIPQDAVDLLVKEREKHPHSPYMFPSPLTGEMYHPDSVVNLHKKILRSAGLNHIRFHDLRHTFATTALQNGIDVKTVSSMLGHYDAGFTLRTYTHATRQKQEQAAEKLGDFMHQVM